MPKKMLVALLSWGALSEAFVVPPTAPRLFRRTGVESANLDVVELAKEYVGTASGFYTEAKPEFYADDFVFRGGVIGPLNKTTYLETMEILGIYRAFDIKANAFGFVRDPTNDKSVHYFVKNRGKHIAKWDIAGGLAPRPGYDDVIGRTEAAQLIFNDDGKIKFLTAGIPVGPLPLEDSNVGGYGAVLGVFSAVGLDVAAKTALNPGVRTIVNTLHDVLAPLNLPFRIPRTKSTTIPAWYAAYES